MSTIIKQSPGKGRGIFAAKPFREGEIIELAHAIVLPNHEIPTNGIIDFYVFAWEGETSAIATGNALLYNHSTQSNVSFTKDFSSATISFVATHSIEEGEEMCIDYGYEDMLVGDDAKRVRGEKQ